MFYFMISIGLITAYIAGMHDGGTIMATAVSSRLFSARKAVILAGLANFCGAVLLGTAVAYTISGDIIDISPVLYGSRDMCYTFAAATFVGAIVWNLITWGLKLPSSSSHTLIGSMIGSGIAAYGIACIKWHLILTKVVLAMIISPALGFALGFLFLKLEKRALRNGTIIWSKRIGFLSKISSFLVAFSYGSNNSQKVMGVIAIGLAGFYAKNVFVPVWVVVSCAAALGLGTITGGYNMIKTVGMDICKIDTQNSFASQLSTISVVMGANITGLPISVPQVITGSVMGVGTEKTPKAVNWAVSKKIIVAWIITIPISALIGGIIYILLRLI